MAKWNGTKVSLKILDKESHSDPDTMYVDNSLLSYVHLIYMSTPHWKLCDSIKFVNISASCTSKISFWLQKRQKTPFDNRVVLFPYILITFYLLLINVSVVGKFLFYIIPYFSSLLVSYKRHHAMPVWQYTHQWLTPRVRNYGDRIVLYFLQSSVTPLSFIQRMKIRGYIGIDAVKP